MGGLFQAQTRTRVSAAASRGVRVDGSESRTIVATTRRIRTRLALLERTPAFAPKCTCPYPTLHWERADGTVIPPYVPCLHASGSCPVTNRPGEEPVHRITYRRVKRSAYPADLEAEFLEHLDDEWDLGDWQFLVANVVRVIVWRDANGSLCYYGPPRFWERLVPGEIIRGPKVPADYEAMIEELKRDDDWSHAVRCAELPRRVPT